MQQYSSATVWTLIFSAWNGTFINYYTCTNKKKKREPFQSNQASTVQINASRGLISTGASDEGAFAVVQIQRRRYEAEMFYQQRLEELAILWKILGFCW